MVALRDELAEAEVLRRARSTALGLALELEAALAEPRVQPGLPAALAQEVVDRRERARGRTRRSCRGDRGRPARHRLHEARCTRRGTRPSRGAGRSRRCASARRRPDGRARAPRRSPRAQSRCDEAVVLDQRDVRARVAAKMPAARSSGIVIGSSKESSFTDGQRSRTRGARRLVGPVGDDHLGARAQRAASASRHSPR